MLALARKIVAGEADDADSVESVFAQAQQVAAEAEALLVDAEFVAEAPAKPLRGRRGQAHGPRIAQLFVWIGKPVTPSCAQLSTAELLGRSPWYSSGLGTLLLSIGDALPGARGATMGRPPAPLPAAPSRPCVPPGPSLSGGGACHALAMAHVCVNVHGPAPCARPHAHQVVRYRVQQAVRRPSARSGTGTSRRVRTTAVLPSPPNQGAVDGFPVGSPNHGRNPPFPPPDDARPWPDEPWADVVTARRSDGAGLKGVRYGAGSGWSDWRTASKRSQLRRGRWKQCKQLLPPTSLSFRRYGVTAQ